MRILNIIITIVLILFYSKEISIKTFLFAISSTLLLIFANLQNDYFDREIDIKKGKRKITLNPSYQFFILFISLFISLLIEIKVFLTFLIMSVLINYYNIKASGKPFGFLITSSVISIGVLSLGFAFGFNEKLIYLIIFSFFFNLAREIVKSYIDYDFDIGFRRTIAISLSKNKTIILIKSLLILLILMLIVVSIILKSFHFSIYTIFSTAIFISYLLNLFSEKTLSKILKFLMFLGLVALLF